MLKDETAMENLARYIIRGVVLAGTHAVPGSGRQGCLYGQVQKNKQELSRPGMSPAKRKFLSINSIYFSQDLN